MSNIAAASPDGDLASAKGELIDLLRSACFSAFQAAPTDSIVKWDTKRPIKIAYEVDYADDELKSWINTQLAKFQWAISDTQMPLFEAATDIEDADILIFSLKKESSFHDDGLDRRLEHKLSLTKTGALHFQESLKNLYTGEKKGASFVTYDKGDQGAFELSNFVGIIAPNLKIFKAIFLRLVSAGLGCGDGRFVPLKSVKSVHTVLTDELTLADMILFNFIYQSDVKNGDSQSEVIRKFNQWFDDHMYSPKFVEK